MYNEPPPPSSSPMRSSYCSIKVDDSFFFIIFHDKNGNKKLVLFLHTPKDLRYIIAVLSFKMRLWANSSRWPNCLEKLSKSDWLNIAIKGINSSNVVGNYLNQVHLNRDRIQRSYSSYQSWTNVADYWPCSILRIGDEAEYDWWFDCGCRVSHLPVGRGRWRKTGRKEFGHFLFSAPQHWLLMLWRLIVKDGRSVVAGSCPTSGHADDSLSGFCLDVFVPK